MRVSCPSLTAQPFPRRCWSTRSPVRQHHHTAMEGLFTSVGGTEAPCPRKVVKLLFPQFVGDKCFVRWEKDRECRHRRKLSFSPNNWLGFVRFFINERTP